MRIATLLLLAAALLWHGCGKHETEPIELDFGYEYFPLEVGRVWEYAIDSILYRSVGGSIVADSSRTYAREVVMDTLHDNTGQPLYRVERYERRSEAQPWQIAQVVTLARSERQAFRTEDNLRFIKLAFPLREGDSWDGNVFFNPDFAVLVAGENIRMFNSWSYRVLEAGVPLQLGSLSFAETATVQNADSRLNILELRVATEQYAKGVGLVSRQLDIFDTQCRICCNGDTGDACQNLPWEAKAEKGFSLRQRLIHFQ
jgi:hypothetical protein